MAHLYRALDLLNTLPESIEHTQQELAIQLSLGPTLMVIKGWRAEEVEQAYNRARELTENLEDQFQERPRLRRLTRIPLLFGTLWGLWLMNWVKGRNRKARRLVNELLALADSLREIRTICWCGRKATMVVRLDGDGKVIDEGAQVSIGGEESYISLCRRHWDDRDIGPSSQLKMFL